MASAAQRVITNRDNKMDKNTQLSMTSEENKVQLIAALLYNGRSLYSGLCLLTKECIRMEEMGIAET